MPNTTQIDVGEARRLNSWSGIEIGSEPIYPNAILSKHSDALCQRCRDQRLSKMGDTMRTALVQVRRPGSDQWFTVPQLGAAVLQREGWLVQALVSLDEVAAAHEGMVGLVRGAQAILTNHLSYAGPSKAETIESLNALLLGAPATEALRAVGVPA